MLSASGTKRVSHGGIDFVLGQAEPSFGKDLCRMGTTSGTNSKQIWEDRTQHKINLRIGSGEKTDLGR